MTRIQIFEETPASWLWPQDEYLSTTEGIALRVSKFYNVPLEKMKHKTRVREVVVARQVAMYLAKIYTSDSLKTIGEFFGGRDHTTVIHSRQTVKDLMDSDREYKRNVMQLKNLIN